MLDNWLHPLEPKSLNIPKLFRNQFGKKITRYEKALPDLSKTRLALLGIGNEDADAVRKALYQLSFPFGRLKIADLGNVRKLETDFVIPILKELLESHIFPIVIGGNPIFTAAQFQAHRSILQSVNLVGVDERIPYHPKIDGDVFYLNGILDNPKSKLFNLGMIGCQSHFLNAQLLKAFDKRSYECLRLGKVRAGIAETEPLIRDADLLSFHIAALRQSEAPGQQQPSPSGFFSEEACQISRYAGMSDKLTSIGFYGFQKNADRKEQTSQLVAQLIWYFLDGFHHRKNDYPATTDGLAEYVVDFKGHDFQLSFWKSSKSSRWWMQVPVKTKRKHRRHRLIPCSYNDYLEACENDLPERLLKAYKRFEG